MNLGKNLHCIHKKHLQFNCSNLDIMLEKINKRYSVIFKINTYISNSLIFLLYFNLHFL